VSDVAKARGITEVAARAGLGRESLYKALKSGAMPRFETVRRLLAALDVQLDIKPAGVRARRQRA
jgi:probable addiction module antidote protein